MEIVETAQQVAQQAQHIAGLSEQVVTLLKAFFAVAFIVTGGVITAVIKTKEHWVPVIRGFARDHRESDPKLGNGSMRDDFNKRFDSLQDMVNKLQTNVLDVGGSLVRSTGAIHERLDAANVRFDAHVADGKPYVDMLDEIRRERAIARELTGREPGRISSPEEREQFRKERDE